MLTRDVISKVIQDVLGRPPEEASFSRSQLAFKDLHDMVEDLIASEEFKMRSWHAAALEARARASKSIRSPWKNTTSDIEWAYETFLGRAPESYEAVASWLLVSRSRNQIVEEFIRSDEFKCNEWHAAASKVRLHYIRNVGRTENDKSGRIDPRSIGPEDLVARKF